MLAFLLLFRFNLERAVTSSWKVCRFDSPIMVSSIQSGRVNELSMADYVVFGTTLALSGAIGIFYAYKDRKKRTAEEYHFGGRDMHPILVTMSLLASFKSATAILGHAADVYTYNTMYIWVVGGLTVMCIGAAHIFIPIFYKLGFTSVFKVC